jgi:hypothetical protein
MPPQYDAASRPTTRGTSRGSGVVLSAEEKEARETAAVFHVFRQQLRAKRSMFGEELQSARQAFRYASTRSCRLRTPRALMAWAA